MSSVQKVINSYLDDVLREISTTHHSIVTPDKAVSNLEMELDAAWAAQESILSGSPISEI